MACFLTPLTRWENPLTRRYYQAAVQQNLFGAWELMCIWGGIGSARGRQWVVPVDQAAAGAALARIAARRAQRGYRRVDNPVQDPVDRASPIVTGNAK